MHRNHRPEFLELDPPADSFSLLLGAEADRARWQRGSTLPTPPASQPATSRHTSAETFIADNVQGTTPPRSEPADHNEESSADFLGRVNSYSRIMRAYAQNQLQCPLTGTVPSYRRTMHDFTLKQLNHYQRSSKSASSSPVVHAKRIALPCRLAGELADLAPVEIPRAPMNTPDGKQSYSSTNPRRTLGDVQGIDFRKLKRSVTEPQGGSCLLLKQRATMVA